MMRKTTFYILSCLLLLLTSCATSTEQPAFESLKYAQLLTMGDHDGWTEAVIKNPWDSTKVLQRLAIQTDDKAQVPQQEGLTVVKAPLSHSLLMSSVHCSLLAEMGRTEAIAAVCDAPYIKDEAVISRLKSGKIKDCGNSMEPTQEAIVMAKPDAMLISPYKDNDLSRLKQLGIPMIQCADYMESSPLGRAEWIRLYGILYGCESLADSIFSAVSARYEELKAMAAKAESKPKVLSDTRYGQVWYVPTPQSTIGQMYADAGAENPFADRKENGSAALSPEEVLLKAQDSDAWVLKSDNPYTLSTLSAEASMHSQIKAFKTGNVWQCNTQKSMYYEQTPFHPELLIEDFIHIFHPELNLPGQTHYFFKLQ